MIIDAVATGRNIDDAIDNACEKLGYPREDVEIEVVDLPKKGFLGLSHTPAKARVWIEIPDAPKPAPIVPKPAPIVHRADAPAPSRAAFRAAPPATEPSAPRQGQPTPIREALDEDMNRPLQPVSERGKIAAEFLTSVMGAMGLENAKITVEQREGLISLRLIGDETGAAIGRRGETLDALQYLTSLAANRAGGDYCRVVLDSGNYRDKRRHTLEQLAKRLAINAVRTGKPTTLEPMNPYERRIIHASVSEIAGAASTSVGDEPNRSVVIGAAGSTIKPTPYSRPNNRREGGFELRTPRNEGGFNQRPPRNDNANRPAPVAPPTPPTPPAMEKVEEATAPKAFEAEFTPRPPRAESGFVPRASREGGRDFRREKPEPYKESGRREVAPSEGSDKPLYGKIEL